MLLSVPLLLLFSFVLGVELLLKSQNTIQLTYSLTNLRTNDAKTAKTLALIYELIVRIDKKII